MFRNRKAFTLIELMIAVLIVSAIGLSLTSFFKKSAKGLRESELNSDLSQGEILATRMISDDISQAVAFESACQGNNPTSGVLCSDVPIHGSISPLSGLNKTDVEGLTYWSLPPSATTPANALGFHSDALRVMIFEDTTPCLLNSNRNDNPEAGTQMIYAAPDCAGLAEGKIYIITQNLGTVTFSDVFQIESLTENAGVEFEIDTGAGGTYGVAGSYGNMGYTNEAVIYPVMMVEYAVDGTDGGLFRRTHEPTAGDLAGKTDWVEISPNVESLQFTYYTSPATGPKFHSRTVDFDDVDGDRSIGDILGVQPHLITISSTESEEDAVYDNPLTVAAENDHFPRNETIFFVEMVNTPN